MEKLMQYVWQHRLFPQRGLRTVDGRPIVIINQGLLNNDAGPDFFNASIRIGDEQWVGNVEIHVRASDWHRHGHDHDKAYDSVILHVVEYDDTIIRRSDGQAIPQMTLQCSPSLNARYHELADFAHSSLPCADFVASLPAIYRSDWISSLGIERLQTKAARIDTLLEAKCGDWEETAYITLARALGFGTNADPFERLARSLPLRFLRKHADSLLAIEALLIGQAGLIDAQRALDPYAERLTSEYRFLATKFGLKPMSDPGWKLARMRPQNFPYRRIALLAAIIHRGFAMVNKIKEIKDIDSARALVSVPLTGFWTSHYTLNGAESTAHPNLSASSADLLIINFVVPIMYAYGIMRGDQAMANRAVDLLHAMKAESNSVVAMFARCGIRANDAFSSQAVIQLRRNYCEQSKCLYCRFGHRKLASVALR